MSDTSNGRVVEVLNFLSSRPTDSFTLSEIAEHLRLSHGSAHRVLTTLTAAGYLSRHPKHKTFSLGLALVMIGQAALSKHRSIDIARREIARLADDLKVQCTAAAIVDDEILLVAKEGVAQTHEGLSRVGERRPFVPPLGFAHMAWSDAATIDAFLAKSPSASDSDAAAYMRQSIELVRKRGYAVAANGPNQHLLRRAFTVTAGAKHDPDYWSKVRVVLTALSAREIQLHRLEEAGPAGVCYISAPVFGPSGTVELDLALSGIPTNLSAKEIERYASRLCAAASVITAETHGQMPI